jgi:Cu/Ag efflux pump CusA
MLLPYLILLAFIYGGLLERSALIIFATLPFAILGSKRALALSEPDLDSAGFVTLTSMVVFVMTMALFLFSIVMN